MRGYWLHFRGRMIAASGVMDMRGNLSFRRIFGIAITFVVAVFLWEFFEPGRDRKSVV